ncbi:hypothetical protein SEA_TIPSYTHETREX_55 [Mycobacterium phage TipsytheTRex]|nr:hypothetical protein SEA_TIPSYTHETREX_55 [Mycobacterium phage TipsytheTRex]
MFELEETVFETWDAVPLSLLVKGPDGVYIKLSHDITAYTADVDSIGGWSGGWIEIPTAVSWHAGPFKAVAV